MQFEFWGCTAFTKIQIFLYTQHICPHPADERLLSLLTRRSGSLGAEEARNSSGQWILKTGVDILWSFIKMIIK